MYSSIHNIEGGVDVRVEKLCPRDDDNTYTLTLEMRDDKGAKYEITLFAESRDDLTVRLTTAP